MDKHESTTVTIERAAVQDLLVELFPLTDGSTIKRRLLEWMEAEGLVVHPSGSATVADVPPAPAEPAGGLPAESPKLCGTCLFWRAKPGGVDRLCSNEKGVYFGRCTKADKGCSSHASMLKAGPRPAAEPEVPAAPEPDEPEAPVPTTKPGLLVGPAPTRRMNCPDCGRSLLGKQTEGGRLSWVLPDHMRPGIQTPCVKKLVYPEDLKPAAPAKAKAEAVKAAKSKDRVVCPYCGRPTKVLSRNRGQIKLRWHVANGKKCLGCQEWITPTPAAP